MINRNLIIKVNGNSYTADIDEATVLAFDKQAWDFKSPDLIKCMVTNSFSIPKTHNNNKIFGFADNPHSQSKRVYNQLNADYFIENYKLLDNAKLSIDSIDNKRINLTLSQKSEFWDDLKLFKWSDFAQEFLIWANGIYGNTYVPIWEHENLDNWGSFIYQTSMENPVIKITAKYGNLARKIYEGGYVETEVDGDPVFFLQFKIVSTSPDAGVFDGGHFDIKLIEIFKFLEYKYGVDFAMQEDFVGNIFTDFYFNRIWIPCQQIRLKYLYANTPEGEVHAGQYFDWFTSGDDPYNFAPHKDLLDKEDKTLYDLVKLVFQRFNVIVQDMNYRGGRSFICQRFDEIINSEVKDWSNLVTDNILYKPYIDNILQENYIKFKSVHETGGELAGSKKLICENKNISKLNTSFIEFDEYYPNLLGNTIPLMDLSVSDALKTFELIYVDPSNYVICKIFDVDWYYNNIFESIRIEVQRAQIYSTAGEWNLFSDLIKEPEFYEIEKYLSLNEFYNLDLFKLYWIDKLNCACFINKISGFNPEKSKEPFKIELIKVSEKTPTFGVDRGYVDGVGNLFTDGQGNIFI